MIWLLVLVPLGLIALSLALHPLTIHRGLTVEEWKTEWFGDEFLPQAKPSGSRAITIYAPAKSVWPWITQIGQDRAGFYSYRSLENLAGAKMPDVRELRSEWSTREVGQKLIMAPVERFGKVAEMDIVAVHPEQALVARNWEGTWAFLLVPLADDVCRFIARGTWVPSRNPLIRFFHTLVFDPIHYLMEWRMLRGIKALAEGASR